MKFLSHDDLPPSQPDRLDTWLREELDKVTTHYFYDTCDPQTRSLLSLCEWYITTCGNALTLMIICPNSVVNWRLLNAMDTLASLLEPLAKSARIRVYALSEEDDPIEMRVDERMIYGDRS